MKVSTGLFFSIMLCLAATEIKAQQVFKTTPTSVIPYLEYVPEDYSANSNKYPIVLFMHGIGERGPNTNDISLLQASIDKVTVHGPPKYVKAGTEFPFILISPQLKNNYSTWPSWYVKEVIDYCMTYLRIDERRIYVTGLSLGGGGAWVAVQDLPEFFAAVAPVCGGYNSPSKACGIASENLPVWAFHGDKDSVVPLSRSQAMVDAINACVPAPSPLAKLTVYQGVAHNAWDYAYKTDNSLHTPNVYQWLLSFTNTVNNGNKIPVANAGADKTTSTKSTTLTGAGTDADGSISSYLWKKMSGPSATLANTTSSTLSLSGLQNGAYIFSMKVTDNNGNTDTDYVKLTIANAAPVANAGSDKTITLPANSVDLVGSGTDSDGSISSFLWTKVSGPMATLSNASSSTLNVTNLIEGTYTFRLTVDDNSGASGTDDIIVTVKPEIAPVANAGADKTVILPTTSVSLTGSATDEDGSVTSYLWTKVSGASVSMTNASAASMTVNGLAAGSYLFRLTATDNTGSKGYDDVSVIVKSSSPPVTNAGSDKTIQYPTTAVTLTGSASDPDGSISSYLWTQVSGATATLSYATTSSLKASKLSPGTYIFRLTTTDDDGNSSWDEATVIVKPSIPPVVNAGTDQMLTMPTNSATLSGSAYDPDGTISSYLWTKISGGTATLANTTTSSLLVTDLTTGIYVFRLTAKDNRNTPSYDEITVTVNPPAGPTVNAGADKLLKLPASSTTIYGSATSLSASITSYAWTQISGNNATMANANTASLRLSGLISGVYQFRLTATTSAGATGFDDVKVTVDAPPVVNAGSDRAITLPLNANIVLNGFANDPDGSIVKYQWSKYSGPNVTLSSAATSSLTISKMYEGSYVFKLAVTDNLGVTGYDYVTVNVTDPATSGSRLAVSEVIVESREFENEQNDFNGATMIIFNDAGREIYSGVWSEDVDRQIIKGGLYFYNMIKDGKTIKTGKIFRRN